MLNVLALLLAIAPAAWAQNTLPTVTAVIEPDPDAESVNVLKYPPRYMIDRGNHRSESAERVRNRGETEAEEKDCDEQGETSKAAALVGNPVVLSTGNKIEREVDFTSSGEMGLYLSRTYNHYWSGAGLFGKHWVSNFDYKLTFGGYALNACFPRPGGGTCGIGSNTELYAWRPDGRTIKYVKNPSDGVFYENKPSPISKVVVQPNGSFILYGEENEVEAYSSAGYIASVRNEHGIGWYYSYTFAGSTYPARVTHTSGRYVEFTWTNGQLTAVRDPAGAFYGFAYHADQFGSGLHRLASSSQPGTPVTASTYHYEFGSDPSALTGKSIGPSRYSIFQYDGLGFARSSRHGPSLSNFSELFTYTYLRGENGLLTVTVVNPLGQQTHYAFQDGKPTSVTGQAAPHCAGRYSETVYDANGYPALMSDYNGNDTAFTYNAKGQLLQKTEAYGTPLARTTQYTWDTARNRLISVTVVGVIKTAMTYTASNRLATVTETNLTAPSPANNLNQSRTTTFMYSTHPNGMLATVMTDGPAPGLGDVSISNYDNQGNRIDYSAVPGQTIAYTNFNGRGQPGRVTGLNGAIADTTYDARGRVVLRRTYPDGTTPADTSIAYNWRGLVDTVTGPDSVATSYSYDLFFRVSKKASSIAGVLTGGGVGEQQTYDYNQAGDVTKVSNWSVEGHYEWEERCPFRPDLPLEECVAPPVMQYVWVVSPVLKQASFTDYDELGRPRAVRGNYGSNTALTYDGNSNPRTATDALGRATSLTYDALDRVIESKDALNQTTHFQYDVAGNVTQVTDPRGNSTAYVYDGFGQLWRVVSPDTGTTSFQYNGSGQRVSMTRANGAVTQYFYDMLGRLESSQSGTQINAYFYDSCTNGNGRLCYAESGNSTTQFTYEPDGRLRTRRDTVNGNGSQTDHWTYHFYDTLGRLSSLVYPNGQAVGYGYASGKLKTLTVNIGGTMVNVVADAKYRPYGRASETPALHSFALDS